MGDYPYQFGQYPFKHEKVMTLGARLILYFFTFSCIFDKLEKNFSSFFLHQLRGTTIKVVTSFHGSILLQRQVMKENRPKMNVFCTFFLIHFFSG